MFQPKIEADNIIMSAFQVLAMRNWGAGYMHVISTRVRQSNDVTKRTMSIRQVNTFKCGQRLPTIKDVRVYSKSESVKRKNYERGPCVSRSSNNY